MRRDGKTSFQSSGNEGAGRSTPPPPSSAPPLVKGRKTRDGSRKQGTIPWGFPCPCRDCEKERPCGERKRCPEWIEYREKVDEVNKKRRLDNETANYNRSVKDRLRKAGKIDDHR